jgi:hypothetical protein
MVSAGRGLPSASKVMRRTVPAPSIGPMLSVMPMARSAQ